MNLIAIDFGTKNIGLAWVDTTIGAVLPFGKIKNSEKNKLEKIINEEKPNKIIIGLPFSLDGQENINTKRIRDFADELKKNIEIPLEFFNEMFTSQQADRLDGGASRDEKSAMIILEDYLAKMEKER
jgi:putative holliday junction resolvase